MGLVLGIGQGVEHTDADRFGDVEAAIHGSGGIGTDDADLIVVALDAVALRDGFRIPFDRERDLRGSASGFGFALDLGRSKPTGTAGAGVGGEFEGAAEARPEKERWQKDGR